jgi:lipooligosaccharide transport system permease protein
VTGPTLALRIVPPVLRTARHPQRMVERSIMSYRHSWMLLVTGFMEPLFYLLSIRIGFAALIGDVTDGGIVYRYEEFVAPALMASAAMNGAIFDATMNVFYKMKNAKLYDAVLTTPMTASDVALGEIGWAVMRGLIYSIAFLGTMWGLGMVGSPLVVLALPACVLIGFAFASIGMACTTYLRSWADMEYVPAITLPLLLFSATFYPLSSYGDWVWVVHLSPLYHGVALVRGFNNGIVEWSMLANAGVLIALAFVGLRITARRIEHLLLR